ncbi:MAG: DUF2029 domain-containing protein [Anaerolineales bacterium]|nr:DUF2029 domain-containing protein [Anaerolineales bacterium]
MRMAWLRILVSVVVLGVLAAMLTAVNLRFTRVSPGGNDFLPRWVGTRLFITERQNPYSAETTAAIQDRMYGRVADEGEDAALFAYPFYSMLVFAPFGLVEDYPLARALWITAQEIAIAITVLAALGFSGWRPSRWPLVALLLFALTWFHSAKPLVDGNAAVMVSMFVALGLYAMRRGRDGLAGLAFALSTIKPQMVLLPLVLIFAWALSQKRRSLLVSFGVCMLVLCGVSFVLQPTWAAENLAQVLLYSSYTPPGTLIGVFEAWWGTRGHTAGLVVSALLGLLLFYEWMSAAGQRFDWLLWTLCVTLTLGPLVGMPSTSSNHVILLLAVVWLLALWQRRTGQPRAVWVLLPILFVGIWALFLTTLPQEVTQFGEHLSLLLVTPIFSAINLYWLRWWLLRPQGVKA